MEIGIDLGGSHIGAGIINSGKILNKVEKDIEKQEKGEENITKLIINTINNLLKQNNLSTKNIKKIGIACPGIIENGTVRKAKNLKIENLNLKNELEKEFENIEIQIKNDAKCAALAEKEYGILKNYENSVMLTIGTGIGGAVFYNGKLLQGKKSEAFELGHIIINKNGKKCSCNANGCFEACASIGNLRKEIKTKLDIKKEITGIELVEILKNSKQNKIVEKILEEYIQNLAIGIANIINIFEPEIIVLGGSIVYYKEIILEKLKNVLKTEEYIFNKNSIPQIEMAKLNNDAGIIGAILV